jgi:heptosyltransferase-2
VRATIIGRRDTFTLALNLAAMRLGVFLPNWVGDVIMATPALRALHRHVGSQGQLIGIMRPYVADVLEGTSWLDEKIIYDKSTNRFGFPGREIIRELQEAQLDSILLFTNSLRTAWMSWRSGARKRVGFRNEARSFLLTNPIRQPRAPDGGPAPTVEGYLHLTSIIGCDDEPAQLELTTVVEDERAADAIWQRFNLPPGERVIVLNSGGAFGAAKQWPTEYFADLARRIVSGGHFSVLVNCGPSEREIARLIAKTANHPKVVTLANCAELPVGLTKACIRRSRLLVTTDSGPRYFGIAFKRPVVTLFGPTDPLRTLLPYRQETSLALSLECQPCMKRTCPLKHHRCMRELTVESVHGAVSQLLARTETESAA